jgi:hypothetical protein
VTGQTPPTSTDPVAVTPSIKWHVTDRVVFITTDDGTEHRFESIKSCTGFLDSLAKQGYDGTTLADIRDGAIQAEVPNMTEQERIDDQILGRFDVDQCFGHAHVIVDGNWATSENGGYFLTRQQVCDALRQTVGVEMPGQEDRALTLLEPKIAALHFMGESRPVRRRMTGIAILRGRNSIMIIDF